MEREREREGEREIERQSKEIGGFLHLRREGVVVARPGFGCRVLVFTIESLGLWVLGCRSQGLGCRSEGSGCGVSG